MEISGMGLTAAVAFGYLVVTLLPSSAVQFGDERRNLRCWQSPHFTLTVSHHSMVASC